MSAIDLHRAIVITTAASRAAGGVGELLGVVIAFARSEVEVFERVGPLRSGEVDENNVA